MSKDDRPKDLMGYEVLQQEALRGVVRAALKRVADTGLPGDHHFFISFKTKAPGVSGPPEVLGQYPDEMKIVLQNQFWDLAPGETSFSVTLKFGGRPKTLSIPYAAIIFYDPSVNTTSSTVPAPIRPQSGPIGARPGGPLPRPPRATCERAPNIVS
jgi:hypothetical protein